MPTLAEVRTLLSRYAGANNDFEDRLNLARARLMKSGNWRDTKAKVIFNVYPDANNAAVVTLPKSLNTILAGVYLNSVTGGSCGYPLPVRNSWYAFSSGGPGYAGNSLYRWSVGFEPEEGWFTTFSDWTTAKFVRLKFATTETNPSQFYVRGNLNGQPVYTGTGAAMIEGEKLTYTGATVTSASQFDEPPYEFVKPATNGRVSMYTWDGTTETLVAIYDPTETVPQWRRYRVPGCSQWTEADPGQFLTICKRAYVPVTSDQDEVIPGNIGALTFGLDALLSEDARDYARAKQLWADAKELLTEEVSDDTGAGAEGAVQVADDFAMCGVGGIT